MGPLILVVDDDGDLRSAIELLLQGEGYQVATARDGQDALRLMRGGLRPALVLTDLMMPRMSGWELRNALREDPALRGIPVIISTGYTQLVPTQAAEPILTKPVSFDLLLSRIEEVLDPAA